VAQTTLAGCRRLGVAAVDTLVGVHGPLEAFLDGILAQRGDAVREDLGVVSDGPVGLSLIALPTAVDLEMIVPGF